MSQTTENNTWDGSSNVNDINQSNTDFGLPNPQDTIWRYQSFARFEQLLNERTLYLSRIDQFWDFREGSATDASTEHAASGVKRLKIDWNNGNIEKEPVTAEDGAWVAGLSAAVGQMSVKNAYHASCWNENSIESSLMWRSYGAPSKDDPHQFRIAIKTKARNLIDSLDLSQVEGDIYCGPVKYLNFKVDRNSTQNINTNVFQKKQEYASENEIRLAVFNSKYLPHGSPIEIPDAPLGITIPVAIAELIEEVYIEAVPALNKKPEDLQQEIQTRIDSVKSILTNAGLNDVKITLSEIL